VFASPLAPLISLYEGSKILAASSKLDRLARAIVRVASSKGISVLGEASGVRIKSALLSFIRAGILGVGLSFGTLMATYGFDRVLRPWLLSSPSTTGSTSMSATLSSIDNNIQIFYFKFIKSVINIINYTFAKYKSIDFIAFFYFIEIHFHPFYHYT
jgi:hypothetical protein